MKITPIFEQYLLAGFGWLLYMVGKLWYFRKEYDPNNDGLGWNEVQRYLKKNWIVGLFNLLLLVVVVPYAEDIWSWGMNFWGKDWAFSDFVYVLAGSFILVIQIIIDFVRSKRK